MSAVVSNIDGVSMNKIALRIRVGVDDVIGQAKGRSLLVMITIIQGLLLAMIAISVVQSSGQTFIHNAILFIDISNNACYN